MPIQDTHEFLIYACPVSSLLYLLDDAILFDGAQALGDVVFVGGDLRALGFADGVAVGVIGIEDVLRPVL